MKIRQYNNLSLSEKLVFQDMIREKAGQSDTVNAVWELLNILEVHVFESDIRYACLEYGWTEGKFHELWKLSNNSEYPLFSL
jgi:hypothetical protein